MHQVLVSENGPHAMTCGENRPDHQSQKITGLENGLHDHDRQRGVQEAKAAVKGEQHRNDKQQRKNRQKDFQPER